MTMTSAELRTLVTCQSGLLDVDCTGEVIEKADFEIFRNMVTPPTPYTAAIRASCSITSSKKS